MGAWERGKGSEQERGRNKIKTKKSVKVLRYENEYNEYKALKQFLHVFVYICVCMYVFFFFLYVCVCVCVCVCVFVLCTHNCT